MSLDYVPYDRSRQPGVLALMEAVWGNVGTPGEFDWWFEDGPEGEAVITTGGNLPARYVIHTVGPVYGQHSGREAELLAACYVNSLELAGSHLLTSIAFPAISTGAFGYPQDEAAQVSSRAIADVLAGADTVSEVRLVFFQRRDADKFLKHQNFY